MVSNFQTMHTIMCLLNFGVEVAGDVGVVGDGCWIGMAGIVVVMGSVLVILPNRREYRQDE
jgi:hypothetical protein